MKKWRIIAAVLIGVVVLWRVMWLNSPMREIERSKAAASAAKSWHYHTVRYFPGLPSETYEEDFVCPGFVHVTDTATKQDGTPYFRETFNYSGRGYVNVDGRWTLVGGTQAQIDANAASVDHVFECDQTAIGADPFTAMPYNAILEGNVHRGAQHEVAGDSCREYDVTVSTPHDPENKEFQFFLCINESDHLPRQTRRTAPGSSQERVSTYTKWNVLKEPPLPPEIPN